MVVVMVVVMVIMALFMRAMIIPMKRNAIRIAEIAVRDTDITPIARCRQSKTMRGRFSIRVSQGVHFSVLFSVLFSMILIVFIAMIIVVIVSMALIVIP